MRRGQAISITLSLFSAGVLSIVRLSTAAADEPPEPDWRPLPLVTDGVIDPAWRHLWGGGFSVMEDGSLRTDCDDTGMGLLLYTREKFGDCQIRVVYRSEDARSNAGVFVRIDEGVFAHANDPLPRRERDAKGRLTSESLDRIAASSEGAREAWYPVHHGYEVQICDSGDAFHRTGAVYSLAPAAAASEKAATEWKTMVITLEGNRVLVDVDGDRLTTFDPESADVPPRKHWFEPRREPDRPRSGFIGLQNHDPGDVVYFKEVSVRPLARAAAPPATAASLRVGVVQFMPVPEYERNCEKMAEFIREAKSKGCRVVIFPERALYFNEDTPLAVIEDTIDELRKVVDAAEIYAVICSWRHDGVKPHNQLVVVDPQGEILQTYNKLWFDARFNEAPGPFEVDGVSCAATICADRWIRSVEELPVMAGAKILIECSNNYDNEWIDDLGWYWYVPRAIRNGAYVIFCNTPAESFQRPAELPGHGHSAVISPDGQLLAAAGGESDRLLVVDLDLSQATGEEAAKRRSHPLFRRFWETGVSILNGQSVPNIPHRPLRSPEIALKIAAAQLACSQRIDENVAKIVDMIRTAAAEKADVVVFPELAVTGARKSDIRSASQSEIEQAVETLRRAAAESKIYVACGLPWHENGRLYNSAVVIDAHGKLLTRYDQVVVDHPELFATGLSTQAMWFELKGVPAVVTIGRDALWNEIAELAAMRGAQVHLHLAYDQDTSDAGRLLKKQLWVNLASYRNFSATVNAASPEGLAFPSAPAAGGSTIWEDFQRTKAGPEGGYFPHSAVRLAEAGRDETIIYATERVGKTNPQFQRITGRTNPQMTPWYAAGVRAIFSHVSK